MWASPVCGMKIQKKTKGKQRMKTPKILLKLESPGSPKIRSHIQIIDKKMERCW